MFCTSSNHPCWSFGKTWCFFSCQNQHLARTKGMEAFKCLLWVWEMQLWYCTYSPALLFWNLGEKKKGKKSCLKSYDRLLFCLMWNVHLTSLLSLICVQNPSANLQSIWFPFPLFFAPPSATSTDINHCAIWGKKKGTWSIKVI